MTVEGLKVQKVEVLGNKVLVTVSGAEFEKEYVVTYNGTTESVKFGKVGQYYTLQLTTDAEDTNDNTIDDIKASGTSTLQLTATIIDNATGEVIEDGIDGAVQFLTTAGALAQQQIVIQNGKASVQLKSVSSLETVYADITAKVVGGSALTGLAGNVIVEFVPEGGTGEASTTVPVVKAQTESADRVTVVLGQPKPGLTADQLRDIARAARVTDSVTGNTVNVLEARQINDSVVELVLDTYNTAQANYLTDNAVHTVAFSRVTNLIEATGTPLSFKLTDSTKQFALGAKGLDQRTIEVRFDNPVAVSTDDTAKFNALNLSNYVLDGKPLSSGTTINVKPGTDGKVVVIKLAAADVIKEEETILQVRNVGDWAGITDSANLISTQDLFLTTIINNQTPVVTVEEQSPEQYLLKLSQPVKATAALDTLIETRYGKVLEEDQTVAGETGKKGDFEKVLDAAAAAQVSYTALDADGNPVNPQNEEFVAILVELTEDWTDILSGSAHWTVAPQLQFKIAKNVFYTDLNNKNLVTNINASNARDNQSPIITDYVQTDADGDYTNGATIVFNEPVQLPGGTQGSTVVTTPNQSQIAKNSDVQAPVVEFSLGNVVVEGEVVLGAAGDFVHGLTTTSGDAFTELRAAATAAEIAPDEDGNYVWTVTVTGVSDDYGNTMATQEFEFVVPALSAGTPQTALEIDPFVVYANYEVDSVTSQDVITIKFSEVMANKDANGVGLVSNYILNSQQLAAAAGAQITRGIDGVTDAWDGVTIKLPAGSVESENFMLTLPSNFTSADGQALTLENVLNFVKTATDEATFTQVNPLTNNKGVLFTNTYDEKAADVLDIAHTIVGTTATATAASITADGYLTDLAVVISFSDAAAATEAETLQVMINGKIVPAATVLASGTDLEIDLDGTTTVKAEDLELTDGDVIEVKINGQTIFVKAVEAL